MKTQANTFANEYDQQAESFLAKHGLKMRITLSDSKTPQWKEEGEDCGHHYRVCISCPSDAARLFPMPVRSIPQTKRPNRLVFDFWGSIAGAQCTCCKGKKTVKLDKPEPIRIPNPDAGKPVFEGYGALGEDGKYKRHYTFSQPSTIPSWKRDSECPHCKGTGLDPEPKHPSAYSVLACISGDAYTPETFADFCAEYGYESDSIKALQQFRRCDRFAKRLRAFFTTAELEELSEIQ